MQDVREETTEETSINSLDPWKEAEKAENFKTTQKAQGNISKQWEEIQEDEKNKKSQDTNNTKPAPRKLSIIPTLSMAPTQRMVNQDGLEEVANAVKKARDEKPMSPVKSDERMIKQEELDKVAEDVKKICGELKTSPAKEERMVSKQVLNDLEKEEYVKKAKIKLALTSEAAALLAQAKHNQSVTAAFLSPPTKEYPSEKEGDRSAERGSASPQEGPQSSSSNTTTLPESRSSSSAREVKFDIEKFAETLSIQSSEAKDFLGKIIVFQQIDLAALNAELKDLIEKQKTISPQEAETLEIVIAIKKLDRTIQHICDEEVELKTKFSEEILEELNKAEQELVLLAAEREDINQEQIQALKNKIIAGKNEIYALKLKEACEQLCGQQFEPEVKTKLSFLNEWEEAVRRKNQPTTETLFETLENKPLEALLVDLGQVRVAITQIVDDNQLPFFLKTLLPALMNFVTSKMTPENLKELAGQCSNKSIAELAAIQKALSLLSLPAHVRPGLADELENFRTTFSVFATTKIKSYSDLDTFSTHDIRQTPVSWLPLNPQLSQLNDEKLRQKATEDPQLETRLQCWLEISSRTASTNLTAFAEALVQIAILHFAWNKGDHRYAFYISVALSLYRAKMLEPNKHRLQYLQKTIDQYEVMKAHHVGENAFEKIITDLDSQRRQLLTDLTEKRLAIEKTMPMHPITRVVASYASELFDRPAVCTLYSDLTEFNEKFSDIDKVFDHYNRLVIRPVLANTILLPQLNLEEEKYIPALDIKTSFSPLSLEGLGISFPQIKEGIKQEKDNIERAILEKVYELLHKERNLEKKEEEFQSLSKEIERIESKKNSLNPSEENDEEIRALQNTETKKLLDRDRLKSEIASEKKAIHETNDYIQAYNSLHGSLSNLLSQPPDPDTNFSISLDMFIAWIQSKGFSQYLQHVFMKYMREQYGKGSNAIPLELFKQVPNLPAPRGLVPRYIKYIASILSKLTPEDPRIPVLQSAIEGLTQFDKQMCDSFVATQKIYDLTLFNSSIAPILRSTFQQRLKLLAAEAFPAPAQATAAFGPALDSTASLAPAPASGTSHSDVKSSLSQRFWKKFGSSSSISSSKSNSLQTASAAPGKM